MLDPAGGGGATGTPAGIAFLQARTTALSRRYQHFLDKTTPFVARRWAGLAAVAAFYFLRVFLIQGFYIVTYGLGIFVLNLLILFLSPRDDPEIQGLSDPAGPSLPTKSSDEFRPFQRRLPEFKFWYAIIRALCVAFVMTFFSVFDIPVFWPILLFYWIVLFTVSMKRQILHMIKYKYVPFTVGIKKRYTGKKVVTTDAASHPNN